jgi:hypothetical protein
MTCVYVTEVFASCAGRRGMRGVLFLRVIFLRASASAWARVFPPPLPFLPAPLEVALDEAFTARLAFPAGFLLLAFLRAGDAALLPLVVFFFLLAMASHS